jgi:hypothetical protein
LRSAASSFKSSVPDARLTVHTGFGASRISILPLEVARAVDDIQPVEHGALVVALHVEREGRIAVRHFALSRTDTACRDR